MPDSQIRILLLDISADTGQTIRYYAEEMGWRVDELAVQPGYMRKVNGGAYSLLLLEAEEGQRCAFDRCAAVKRSAPAMPVVILTSDNVEQRLDGFKSGADDCLSKPFSARELFYRIRSIIGRTVVHEGRKPLPPFRNRLMWTQVEVERHTPVMRINRSAIRLSGCEHKLMRYLSERRNHTVSRDELLQFVWKSKEIGYFRTVDTNIRRIREKLKQISPDLAGMIRTERGRGYCLIDPAAESL